MGRYSDPLGLVRMFQREDQAGTVHPPTAAWTTCSWLRGRGFGPGVKGRRDFCF